MRDLTRLVSAGEDLLARRVVFGVMNLASPADLQADRSPLSVRPGNVWADLWRAGATRGCQGLRAVCIPRGARLRGSDVPKGLQVETGIRDRAMAATISNPCACAGEGRGANAVCL